MHKTKEKNEYCVKISQNLYFHKLHFDSVSHIKSSQIVFILKYGESIILMMPTMSSTTTCIYFV